MSTADFRPLRALGVVALWAGQGPGFVGMGGLAAEGRRLFSGRRASSPERSWPGEAVQEDRQVTQVDVEIAVAVEAIKARL